MTSHHRRARRLLAAATVTIVATAMVVGAGPASAAPPSNDPTARFQKAPSSGPVDTSFKPLSVDANGRVAVVVQMTGDPVAVVQADKGRKLSDAERASVKGPLKKQQDAITGTIKAKGGKIVAQMQSAYNGIQVTIPVTQVDAVAALPGVVGVHAVTNYKIDNAVSVPFLGVPEVWQNTGYTGKNVKIGIIDTGIDYTHANFAGPGTVAAYDEAKANDTQPANPAWFGPNAPRVKGGTDLVGDDYNADAPNSQPQPDPNPLDCEGHGSHVAGTAAGNGVTADGKTYSGPYDASTPSKTWTIGPGVAPQADLYAIRVFGCAGSTNVVVPAIDWAVDHGMDVINMSLGSALGRGDDPDAVAASNAVGAGVVVVAAAGNNGPSPYIVSSPGDGDGVIAVSAIDSTATFPGATINLSDGTKVSAINANGADLSGLSAMPVIYLKNDPNTSEDESLGCSVNAYTSNGVTSGGNQLAVAKRGICARVAKAIFAQQAGAAVSVMVNTDNTFPPFEGPITSNPDDNTPYTVTIPFLGVQQSSGPALAAAASAGETATVTAATLQNPGFRRYASFSSSGPRSGDSALGPDVAAPGVSIVSTGAGSGNGAATMSGTSQATPHVAGVAALAVQAHPTWSSADIVSAIVSTADPDKLVGEDLTRGGVGLVDAAQSVATQVTVAGDEFRTTDGRFRQTALNFGFQESSQGFRGTKQVQLTNHGATPVTYRVSAAASAQSLEANVTVSRSTVTVPAHGSAKVTVQLSVSPGVVPGVDPSDKFSFYQVSGDVVFTSNSSTLRVPYLLVPRETSRVSAQLAGRWTTTADSTKSITLRNPGTSLAGTADFYTWGLSDRRDADRSIVDTGYDLRAAGVQSFDTGDDQLLVFAVNNYQRWSNAASNEFDVPIDTNGDGNPDYVVFAADQGEVTAGAANGVSGVFVFNVGTGQVVVSGFLAAAPTDSSTILMPVFASALGLSASVSSFRYTVESFSDHGGSDAFDAWAAYDPWSPALSNGQFEQVDPGATLSVPVELNAKAFAAQKPLGVMTVAIDNAAGQSEGLLTQVR